MRKALLAQSAILMATALGSGSVVGKELEDELTIPYRMNPMYGSMMESYSFTSPIFIPRKHPKMKYADHKRMKVKRKNKAKFNR